MLYLLFVVDVIDGIDVAPLDEVIDGTDTDESLSRKSDDVTGVSEGVNGATNDETDFSDEAVDIFDDSSASEDDDDTDANSEVQRRRFDKTVDFWTNAAITNALPVACAENEQI